MALLSAGKRQGTTHSRRRANGAQASPDPAPVGPSSPTQPGGDRRARATRSGVSKRYSSRQNPLTSRHENLPITFEAGWWRTEGGVKDTFIDVSTPNAQVGWTHRVVCQHTPFRWWRVDTVCVRCLAVRSLHNTARKGNEPGPLRLSGALPAEGAGARGSILASGAHGSPSRMLRDSGCTAQLSVPNDEWTRTVPGGCRLSMAARLCLGPQRVTATGARIGRFWAQAGPTSSLSRQLGPKRSTTAQALLAALFGGQEPAGQGKFYFRYPCGDARAHPVADPPPQIPPSLLRFRSAHRVSTYQQHENRSGREETSQGLGDSFAPPPKQ